MEELDEPIEERDDEAEEAAVESDAIDDEAPRPKKKAKRKKKKKRRAATGETTSARASEDDAEESAPAPLPGAGTTEGDLLREAHRLFEVGDYKRVREHCKKLEADAEDAAVADAARNLRERVEIDPIQIVVLTCCAAALGAILYTWVL